MEHNPVHPEQGGRSSAATLTAGLVYHSLKQTQTNTPDPEQEPDVERDQDGSIKAVKFTILWSEGSADSNLEFSTWDAVNAWLQELRDEHAANYGPSSLCYFKTKFRIDYADGEVYEGRIDVNSTDFNLGKHVYDFVSFHTGLRCPAHMTEDQYQGYLSTLERRCPGTIEQYRRFVETYEIQF